jgi:hypothetical protein
MVSRTAEVENSKRRLPLKVGSTLIVCDTISSSLGASVTAKILSRITVRGPGFPAFRETSTASSQSVLAMKLCCVRVGARNSVA